MEKSIYSSVVEFREKDHNAYAYALETGKLLYLCDLFGWKRPLIMTNWTYEMCKSEAMKYSDIKEWRIRARKSYNAAKINGWWNELSKNMTASFVPSLFWTKERCIEEALKYTGRTEWCKSSTNSYKIAKKNAWFDECTKHMTLKNKPKDYWSKELCLEEALKYKHKEQWKKEHNNSYAAARRNGWYLELTAHMSNICTPNYWTKERCMEEAKKFTLKEDWKKQHPPTYQAAQRRGWINELAIHMPNKNKNNGYWTKERCMEEALKFNTISDWSKCGNASIQVARTKNWMDDCSGHMTRLVRPPGYWTKERCMEISKNHKTKNEWFNNGDGSYQGARRLNIIDECCTHMIRLKYPQYYWTKERCMEEALKFNTIKEWKTRPVTGSATYNAACRNKWIDECTAHMRRLRGKNNHWTKEMCLEEAKKYQYKLDWKKNSPPSYNKAKGMGWFNECSTHMTRMTGKKLINGDKYI